MTYAPIDDRIRWLGGRLYWLAALGGVVALVVLVMGYAGYVVSRGAHTRASPWLRGGRMRRS